DRRPDGHQPGDPGLDGDGVDVRHAERDVRQPDGLRHRAGDSAVRVTNGKPTTLATLRECVHVVRELANGRSVDYNGSTLRLPWASRSSLQVWIAAYGPKALQLTGEIGDGFILQLADPDIAAWTIKSVREA